MGILFKNSEALETAHRLNSIALDKTGTITKGEPTVTDIIPADGFDENEVLRIAAIAERASEHPLAEAIVHAANTNGLQLTQPDQFEAESGRGVQAIVDGRKVLIGSPRFLNEQGIDQSSITDHVQRLQTEAKTIVSVAIDQQLAGVLGIADTIKAGSIEAIASLQALGIDVAMITGDNEQTAQAIGQEVGIRRVMADVLPSDKAAVIQNLQKDNDTVAMVGDGINDAPALAQADVGIAIGTGTDIAMEASDVTLISGDLRGVVRAIHLSNRTMRTIYQNLFWAFVYNIVLIPVAMLGLLIPMFAAAAMAFSSVFVVSNSLRLRNSRIGTSQDMQEPHTVSQEPLSAKI